MLGKLLVRIEMKIKLSIPSTTSMAISVARATQVVGSENSWISDSIDVSSCWRSGSAPLTGTTIDVLNVW